MTSYNKSKIKCSSCGYKCIEKNTDEEKKIHEDIGHPIKGEKIRWI